MAATYRRLGDFADRKGLWLWAASLIAVAGLIGLGVSVTSRIRDQGYADGFQDGVSAGLANGPDWADAFYACLNGQYWSHIERKDTEPVGGAFNPGFVRTCGEKADEAVRPSTWAAAYSRCLDEEYSAFLKRTGGYEPDDATTAASARHSRSTADEAVKR